MRKGIVAIVGRPNVGKSTLFNRLCRKRSAIVDAMEGITRDRKYEIVEWTNKTFYLVDTGGIVFNPEDDITKAVKTQAEIAISEADLILFIVDAKVDVTALDMEIGKLLTAHHHKVLLVANKADTQEEELDVFGFMKLGFGEPQAISATHGRHIGDLLDSIIERLETSDYEETEIDEIKVSIVGKPNVGKSSLLNRLVGENTAIVDKVPGTTRDAIDSNLRYHAKNIRLIDTAGLRRKKSIKYGVEYFSVMRTIESIDRSDIVVLMIAADDGVTEQDQKIASYAARNYKSIIITVNKWDLITKDNKTIGNFVKDIREDLSFINYAPIVFISALTNLRLRKILDLILQIDEESKKRISTSELNDFMEKVVGKFPPAHSSGKHTKIYYCTQPSVQPPVFIFFCNNAKFITESYRRYLHNQLRERFKFEGVTIKTIFRSKERQKNAK
ncbi:MAG: ribosome biogenesis GTPase Der [Candidatus Cloacimonetes bacterium]|nr:ribosome biogenesis GTPase Der [Candidatus Cloacimonadota bacterium]